MKKLNKLLALALAVILTLSLCTGVFAADPTAKAADLTDHIYKAYQIFSGTQTAAPDESTELGNIVWGTGIKVLDDATTEDNEADDNSGEFLTALKNDSAFNVTKDSVTANAFAECTDAASVAKVLSENPSFADDFARVAYEHITAAGVEVEEGDTLAAGYYLIVDVTENTDGDADFVNNLALLQLTKAGDIEIKNKVDVPEVIKEIVEEDGNVKANNAGIGDYVEYQFTGTMPSDLADYDTYYYVFHDTLSKGLTYVTGDTDHPLKVVLVNEDEEGEEVETVVTSYFYKASEAVKKDNVATGETALTVGIADILALNQVSGFTVDKDTKVIVTYYAQVNEDAVIGGANPNEVKLEYSNNPNDDGDGATTPPSENPGNPATGKTVPTGETPKDITVTYVTMVKVFKVDDSSPAKPLTGAEFTLTGDTNKVKVSTSTTYVENEEDEGAYYGLVAGGYTTVAPEAEHMEAAPDGATDGYVLFAEDDTGDYITVDGVKYRVVKESETPAYILIESNEDLYDGKTYDKKVTTTTMVDSENTDIKAFVDEEGIVSFEGLGAGTYTLTESVTPAGYNTIAPITFTIEWEGPTEVTTGEETCTWTVGTDDDSVASNVAYVAADNAFEVIIENQKGSTLPETGGIGTTIFYVIGGILLVGAAVLLITKKRMGAEA